MGTNNVAVSGDTAGDPPGHSRPNLGQRRYGLAREALEPLLQLAKACFDQGQSVAEVLEGLMPA